MINENKFNLIFSFITILILFISSLAFAKNNGTTTANFLRSEVGARAVAMGGAFVALADDINAIYYNPSGLVNIKFHEVTFVYNQTFMDSSHSFLVCGFNLRDKGSLGVSLAYAGVSDVKKIASLDPTGTGSIFSATDLVLSLSYAKSITSRVSLGNSLKIIRGSIEKKKALEFAADFGILAELNDTLSFGLSLQNLGTKMKYIEKEDNLPLNIKAGTALKLLDEKLLLTLDVNKSTDSDMNVKTGAEYKLFSSLALRCGYFSGSSDISSSLSFGLGLRNTLFDLDLSYIPYEDVRYVLRIGVSYKKDFNHNYATNMKYEECSKVDDKKKWY